MEFSQISTIIQIALYLFGSIAVLLTILPLFNISHWVFRIGDFPRLQIAFVCLFVALILPLVAGVDLKLIVFELILTISFAYQISRIIQYTKLSSKQVQRNSTPEKDSTIKILISNVLIENRNYKKLLELIESIDPDVILLAEVDDWWDNAVSSIKNKYTSYKCYPLDNAYGMNFYSKLRTENCKINFIVEDDIPSIETDIILRSGEKIKFYGLHPRPPYPAENEGSAERDAELLIVGKEIKKNNLPTIVAGDLNDVAWSHTNNLFQRISGLLDARIGRGFYNSFHAKYWFMRMPLDHVFQSNNFRLVEIKRLESIGSDHFPIYIELSLESDAEYEQEELKENDYEKKEASEKIIEGSS